MRTTELCEMMKTLGRKHNLIEVDSKKKKNEKGKPDTIIISPELNSLDQRR